DAHVSMTAVNVHDIAFNAARTKVPLGLRLSDLSRKGPAKNMLTSFLVCLLIAAAISMIQHSSMQCSSIQSSSFPVSDVVKDALLVGLPGLELFPTSRD